MEESRKYGGIAATSVSSVEREERTSSVGLESAKQLTASYFLESMVEEEYQVANPYSSFLPLNSPP